MTPLHISKIKNDTRDGSILQQVSHTSNGVAFVNWRDADDGSGAQI